jgi:hypothetical protein
MCRNEVRGPVRAVDIEMTIRAGVPGDDVGDPASMLVFMMIDLI